MRERDLANAQKRQAREDKRSKQHTDEGSDKLQKEAVEDAERAAERITSAARWAGRFGFRGGVGCVPHRNPRGPTH